MKKLLFVLFLLNIIPALLKAQENNNAHITGNFQVDMQTYRKDTLIGADEVPEKLLLNSYANINYVKNNFSAGFRYEGYFNTLQGYDSKNDGYGIPYKYASYTLDGFEVTVGNFYEQFSSGLTFRTYEDKNIGYDNAMEGIRIKFSILKGFYLKGIIGKQRYAFSKDAKGFSYVNNKGLIRGLDAEISLNEMFAKFTDSKTQLQIGGSFVSKYQPKDIQYITIEDSTYKLDMPENVAAFSGRFNLTRSKIGLSCEYAYKFNDPSADNGYIYKSGNGIILNATYSTKGFGLYVSVKRVDNMSFRSDRTANLNNLNINYLPDITKNHTYSFAAMYPYSTQPNGEIGFQVEVTYKIPKGSKVGGKYGTGISVNYSKANSIEKTQINNNTAIGEKGTDGYKSDFFAIGDEIYYQDFNIEINRKLSKSFKFTFIYQNLMYNNLVIQGEYDKTGNKIINANVAIFDGTYKINDNNAVRLELQSLFTKDDMGNWAMALIEYTISPNWFFTVSDQYNYGNLNKNLRTHYYNAAFGYVTGATRVQIGYGKQKEGIVCVGGVCRAVPATNGVMISITSSF